MASRFDLVVVGGGPNGLAAAITAARAGRSVLLVEANDTIGGACRSAELTEPGAVHDLGSAIHPMVRSSPFFRDILDDLTAHGLEWVMPLAGAAHPLDDGRAGIAWNDLDTAAAGLGDDEDAYRSFYEPWVNNIDDLLDLSLNPLLRVPKRPIFSARFGAMSALPAATLARRTWKTDEARALFAGHAAHAILPLESPFTSSFGILLGSLVHSHGWGFPAGGAQKLSDAMAAYLQSLGGTIELGRPVRSLADLPDRTATILSMTPRQVADLLRDQLGARYESSLRSFTYGPGAWKVDLTLDGPIPWANPDVAQAGTVHVGGTLDEVARTERTVADGRVDDAPFVLVAQHSNFDPTRAPDGVHTVWAYCHVPNGSTTDQTTAIENQIERFAPGFRDRVRHRHVTGPTQLESMNANLVGGDIGGGSYAGRQLFFRPTVQAQPFDTPVDSVFMASASTSPGAGVHGMAGFGAAKRVLSSVLA